MSLSIEHPASLHAAANAPHDGIFRKIDDFRAELSDLAFVLERRGRMDAADLARAIAERLAGWGTEANSNHAESPAPARLTNFEPDRNNPRLARDCHR